MRLCGFLPGALPYDPSDLSEHLPVTNIPQCLDGQNAQLQGASTFDQDAFVEAAEKYRRPKG